ncbi:MAG: c-type cytochrome biogenesis protein CcsB [Desulfosarcina sp.]|nr:c-type cytochrome biogenesis protein CcsB [Desulfobacterales bacterium]
MNSSSILSIITFVYGAAVFLYLFDWVFKKSFAGRIATVVTALGLAGNTAGILLRWVESYRLGIGHAPLSNLYESLVFFAWCIALLYLFVEWKYKKRVFGIFSTALACGALAYASLKPDQIQPLIPALKSNWLIAHVFTCFIGYASFAIAFGISLIYLLRWFGGGALRERLPSDKLLDELTHQLIMFGFIFLSAGIISGAVWANSAWGRYWGWDPKETWSLVTWFVYAGLLHARLMRGWQGSRIAVMSIVGFLAVLFTYFGVNYLPGLHSYGAMGG